MHSLMCILGMLGGIAMALVLPLLLVYKCGLQSNEGLLFVTVISVVSICCGFALCRHCLLASRGEPEEPPKTP